MHIVHGTWIPRETDAYRQDGDFWLWVETDRSSGKRKHSRVHPRHLSGRPLETFLHEKLGVRLPYEGQIARLLQDRAFVLPTADGAPLPSAELLPYVDMEAPESWELQSWDVCCWRMPHV